MRIAAFLLATAFLAGRPKVEVVTPDAPTDVPVARLVSAGADVQVLRQEKWAKAAEGRMIRTGESLRTGPDIAILRFPWLRLVAGPETHIAILPSLVLSASLETGRVEQSTKGEDIIKLVTREAVVRGSGHLVVRRLAEHTLVSALDGSFDVANSQGTVHLAAGEGTVVEKSHRGSPPAALPKIAHELTPGRDPVYFREREPVVLRWDSTAPRHHVQVMGFDSDEVVYASDVDGVQLSLHLPLGLFRWHVSTIGDDAPEGRPSVDGYVCVVAD